MRHRARQQTEKVLLFPCTQQQAEQKKLSSIPRNPLSRHFGRILPRTRARWRGSLAWAKGLAADNMVSEEESQPEGHAPSAEFQAAYDPLARRLWGVRRSLGKRRSWTAKQGCLIR